MFRRISDAAAAARCECGRDLGTAAAREHVALPVAENFSRSQCSLRSSAEFGARPISDLRLHIPSAFDLKRRSPSPAWNPRAIPGVKGAAWVVERSEASASGIAASSDAASAASCGAGWSARQRAPSSHTGVPTCHQLEARIISLCARNSRLMKLPRNPGVNNFTVRCAEVDRLRRTPVATTTRLLATRRRRGRVHIGAKCASQILTPHR